ncbi:MAG: asparagine synthase-related protein, partial [Vicinamibacterales bacterium]
AAGSSLLDRVLYADVKTYLAELLMKQDQMSMAASVESRVPFLDHPLVEFAARLPDGCKLSRWTTKRILREAMTGVLPRRILRRPKMGFPVPVGMWLRGPACELVRDVLLDRRARQRGVLAVDAVERLIDGHVHGRVDAGDQLWSLLNLELWYRTFIDGDGCQTLPPLSSSPTALPSRVTCSERSQVSPDKTAVRHGSPA